MMVACHAAASAARAPLRLASVAWGQLQLSARGQYSVERMAALDEYARKAPAWRVVLVLVLTPVPALCAIMLVNLAPLADPSAGWRANYGFWWRLALGAVVLCESVAVQAQHMVPELPIAARTRLAVSLATTVTYIATSMAIAQLWTFPIPFQLVTGAAPCSVLFVALWALVLRKQPLHGIPMLRERFHQILGLVGVQSGLLLLYPAYNACFVALPDAYQPVFVLLLPVMKLLFKNVVARFMRYWEDLAPPTTIFTVEIFNSLYLSSCMQGAGSMMTVVLIIAIDAVQAVLSLRAIFARMRSLDGPYRQCALGGREHEQHDGRPRELLALVQWLCFRPKLLDPAGVRRLRLKAYRPSVFLSHETATQTLTALDALDLYARPSTAIGSDNPLAPTRDQVGVSKPSHEVSWSQVVPIDAAPSSSVASSTHGLGTTTRANAKLVRDTLQLLFHCEYVVLVEYTEAIVPIIYAIYLAALSQSPTVCYYPFMAGFTGDKLQSTVSTIAVYALLEALSLLVLHVVLQRRFGVSPLSQLAFVLESHVQIVQSRLFIAMILTLQFTMVHLGVDYTFHFDWIHRS